MNPGRPRHGWGLALTLLLLVPLGGAGQGLAVSSDRVGQEGDRIQEVFVGCFLASARLLGTKAHLSEFSGYGYHSSIVSSLGGGEILASLSVKNGRTTPTSTESLGGYV